MRKRRLFRFFFRVESIIFLLALSFGAVALFHDMPVLGNSIEGQSLASSFRLFINPDFFSPCCATYPPLYFYFTSILTLVLTIFLDRDAFIVSVLVNPSFLTLLFRSISVISFGLLTLFLYLTARDIYGKAAGFLAVFLTISTPSLIRYATLGQSEMLLVAVGGFVLWVLAKYLISGQRRFLILAAFLCAVAVSLKYNAAVFLIAVLSVVFLGGARNFFKTAVLLLFVFGFFSLVFHPYIPVIIFSKPFIQQVISDPSPSLLERFFPPGFFTFVSYLRYGDFTRQIHANIPLWLAKQAVSKELLMGAFFVLSVPLSFLINAISFFRRKPSTAVIFETASLLLVLAMVFWISTLRAYDGEFHYLLPLYPSAILLTTGLWARTYLLKGRFFRSVFFCLSLLLVFSIIRNLRWQIDLLGPTTYQRATAWIYENTRGQTIVRGQSTPLNIMHPKDSFIEGYGALPERSQKIIDDYLSKNPLPLEVNFRYDLFSPLWPEDFDQERIKKAKQEPFVERMFKLDYLTIERMKQMGVRYVFFSEVDLVNIDVPSRHPAGSFLDILYKREQEAYKKVLNDPRIKLELTIPSAGFRGPTIYVYRII